MTHKTKNETFFQTAKLSSDFRGSRFILINVAIEIICCVYERIVCMEWTKLTMDGKQTRLW